MTTVIRGVACEGREGSGRTSAELPACSGAWRLWPCAEGEGGRRQRPGRPCRQRPRLLLREVGAWNRGGIGRAGRGSGAGRVVKSNSYSSYVSIRPCSICASRSATCSMRSSCSSWHFWYSAQTASLRCAGRFRETPQGWEVGGGERWRAFRPGRRRCRAQPSGTRGEEVVEVRSDRRVQTAVRVAKWASAARSVLCAIETR